MDYETRTTGAIRDHELLSPRAGRATRCVSKEVLNRHLFPTHLLNDHNGIRTVQDLLGQRDLSTTMLYTHLGPANQLLGQEASIDAAEGPPSRRKRLQEAAA